MHVWSSPDPTLRPGYSLNHKLAVATARASCESRPRCTWSSWPPRPACPTRPTCLASSVGQLCRHRLARPHAAVLRKVQVADAGAVTLSNLLKTVSNLLKPAQTVSNRIKTFSKPSQTASNRLKPSQTVSNRLKPDSAFLELSGLCIFGARRTVHF